MTCRFCNRVRKVLRSVGVPIPMLVEDVRPEEPKCQSFPQCMRRQARAKLGKAQKCTDCRFTQYRVQ